MSEMRSKHPAKIYLVWGIALLLASCKNPSVKADSPYFEGQIKLSESQGLYGSMFKVHTTYSLSENFLKREQRMGGINAVVDIYAGCIVDLVKDSITFYYSDQLTGKKIKHSTSLEKARTDQTRQKFPKSLPSPTDNTFRLLPDYDRIKQVKDSTEIQEFLSDYTLYRDNSGILKQEIFDSKKILVKRILLESVIPELPEDINFVLRSDLRTTISDIRNDSILEGKQAKAIDHLLKDLSGAKDQTLEEERTLDNKWIDLGLRILKKGVDLNIHITSDINEISSIALDEGEFMLTDPDFIEVPDIDDFINELPQEGSIDIDD